MGLVTEEKIDAAWTRAFSLLFKAGRFDPPESVEWSKYGANDIASEESKQISFEAALQGQVLLKNDGVLPLKGGEKVAVIGPMSR
jgi:beta-glucosidase